MLVVISGSHASGKSTLSSDVTELHPDFEVLSRARAHGRLPGDGMAGPSLGPAVTTARAWRAIGLSLRYRAAATRRESCNAVA